MGITIKEENGNVAVMQITGLFRKSELDAVQQAAAKKLGPDGCIKLLIIIEDFEGWERNKDWGDISFYEKYGEQITKIAIVGDPKWETEFKMFTGAGFRTAPVKFFPSDQLTQARSWLAE